MKKKAVLWLIMGCLAAAVLGGCGTKDAAKTADDKIETQEQEEDEEDDEDDHDEKDAKSKEEEEENGIFEYPILGQEDIEGYDGFEYLKYELLTTDSGITVPVYAPTDEYASIEEDSINGYNSGIYYSIELEPIIRADQEDYRINENLDYYLEVIYDPSFCDDALDLEIGDAERIDRNTACATVECCRYNEYTESYYAVFETYFLKKLDNDVTVLVEVTIESYDVTEETADIIDEMEAFYQFEIDWSKKRAEEKIDDLIESGDGNTGLGGTLAFEIPEDWSKDPDASDLENYVYAPYGDVELAECFVSISREYVGLDASDIVELERNKDLLVAMVKQQLDNDDEYIGDVEFYGKTELGPAVKVEMQTVDDDDITVDIHMYWIFSEDYMYVVTAAQYGDDAWDDPYAVAEIILENIRTDE